MKTKFLTALSMAALLVAGTWTVVLRADAADIAQMVANAKTAADHEAIANYYDQQAAGAEQQAKEHLALKDEYEKMHAYRTEQNFGGKKPSWHCLMAEKSYEDIAKADRALAQGHRAMAAKLGASQ